MNSREYKLPLYAAVWCKEHVGFLGALASWFLGLVSSVLGFFAFLLSWLLVPDILGSWFLGLLCFLVHWILGFLASWFLGSCCPVADTGFLVLIP